MSIGLTRDEYDEEIAAYEARIKELEADLEIAKDSRAIVDKALHERRVQVEALRAENQRLRGIIPTLKRALLDISLCSQNSMTSKRECGILARTALDATSELLGGGNG